MSINVNELINAARSIAKGEGDYILITKEELMETCKAFHETKKDIESRLEPLEPREPITEQQPVANKPEETASVATSYRPVKYGEADPNDSAGDIEMSNKPVYYVPVGDGLYRPTLDRRIFLFHACMALCKGKKANASFGEQYEYLIECGFEEYDICLATKMKEADAGRMIGKTNDDIPYYVRTKWSMCFDTHRPWHPITIKKNNASKAIEQKQEEEDQATLKKLFNNEEQEETTAAPDEETTQEEANTLVGSKYYIKTILSTEETPFKFEDYPNFLNVCVREEGARGCGTSYPNLDAISKWLKEDTVAAKELPFSSLKEFTGWCGKYQISAKQFFAAFDRKYNAQLAFTIPLVEAVNTRLGISFFTVNAKRNPRPEKQETVKKDTAPKPVEEEYITNIKRILWQERKYGIQTLRKLFTILDTVATRQQIIDLFHIQMDELNRPTELNKNTAIEINKFCGKSVAIGNV